MAALFGVSRSVSGQSWHLRAPDERLALLLQQRHGLSAPLAGLLSARLPDAAAAESFITPSLRTLLPDPLGFKGMDAAIDRLIHALRTQEPIVIYGDYDCDGATSSALIRRYLQQLGMQTFNYIPDRLREGYGGGRSSIDAVRALLSKAGAGPGQGLVIMLDCNSRAFDLIDYANSQGVSVIIGDHHKMEARLPAAAAIINPHRFDENPGMPTQLVSAGIAFMMMGALGKVLHERGLLPAGVSKPDMRDFLDLVALGTVADVGHLGGVNRALVAAGLRQLAQSRWPGVRALLQLCEIDSHAPLAATRDIGFKLGPCLNAPGRIGLADVAVRLLTEDDPYRAQSLAEKAFATNQERRALQEDVLQLARAKAHKQVEAGAKVLVVSDTSWHPGVVGIMAARLRGEFGLPTFVFGLNPELGEDKRVGSGRSIPDGSFLPGEAEPVDLGEAVISAQLDGLFAGNFKGGGHAMAAGATIPAGGEEEFRLYLEHKLAPELQRAQDNRPLYCDQVISLGALTAQLAQEHEQVLEPCGKGNPAAIYAIQAAELRAVMPVAADPESFDLVFYNSANEQLRTRIWEASATPLGRALHSGQGQRFHLALTLRLKPWNGRTYLRVSLHDAAPA